MHWKIVSEFLTHLWSQIESYESFEMDYVASEFESRSSDKCIFQSFFTQIAEKSQKCHFLSILAYHSPPHDPKKVQNKKNGKKYFILVEKRFLATNFHYLLSLDNNSKSNKTFRHSDEAHPYAFGIVSCTFSS